MNSPSELPPETDFQSPIDSLLQQVNTVISRDDLKRLIEKMHTLLNAWKAVYPRSERQQEYDMKCDDARRLSADIDEIIETVLDIGDCGGVESRILLLAYAFSTYMHAIERHPDCQLLKEAKQKIDTTGSGIGDGDCPLVLDQLLQNMVYESKEHCGSIPSNFSRLMEDVHQVYAIALAYRPNDPQLASFAPVMLALEATRLFRSAARGIASHESSERDSTGQNERAIHGAASFGSIQLESARKILRTASLDDNRISALPWMATLLDRTMRIQRRCAMLLRTADDEHVLGDEPPLKKGSTVDEEKEAVKTVASTPEDHLTDLNNAYERALILTKHHRWGKANAVAIIGLHSLERCRELAAQAPIQYEAALHFICLRHAVLESNIRLVRSQLSLGAQSRQYLTDLWNKIAPHISCLVAPQEFLAETFQLPPKVMEAIRAFCENVEEFAKMP